MEDIPEIPEEIKSRIQQYQNTRSASFADWLPDDKGILITTRFGNTAQLHKVAQPEGARNQITFFDEPVTDGLFSPSKDHNGFLYTKDAGGNEFSQIYWYNINNSQSEMLSDGVSRNFAIAWSNDGKKFSFTSTRRNKKDNDIYVSNMSSPKDASIVVDKGNGYWVVTDWSPDDNQLTVIQYLSINKSNSYIFDFSKNELKQINDNNKEAVFRSLAWNQGGGKLYVITNEGEEFDKLAEYDIKSGKYNYITKDINWDVDEFVTNKARTKGAFTVNENGFSQLYLIDLLSNKYEKATNLPISQISGLKFHPSQDKIGMVINSTNTPGDIYVYDLKTKETVRWTYSEVGGLNMENFPKPELIEFETFDEVDGHIRKIPAFVFKPTGIKDNLPVLISIHGGPEGQYKPRFSSGYAHLVNELGIAIVVPNVRGSSGYGKTYVKLDNGYNREHSVKDIGKLIEWIEKQPEYDASRIAVIGGSYGGYMVLSSMFNFNDKLKCGIDIVGISNFVTFLENTEEYRRDLRRAEYGDERDPKMRKFLTSISPTAHVDKITKPLFVIQGANDPRVPASESEQMVKKIRENNGIVWYMLAKDEGHGFKKKENQDRMTEAVALFLKENLLNK
ncbi:S9 family peptidase [Carboxylicivirga marina]|uniref:S9 family peptidase n=2 Tax=Carboxylicivirga marina TaxID=2800988 RepID=A0ABS1HPK6_9BACT|nr:prolyl oligopeptidase family serine peptidase [Carboxylicivirga marina]MBK3519571.1 S9 family peptidase [Carboxylicivirga marina]